VAAHPVEHRHGLIPQQGIEAFIVRYDTAEPQRFHGIFDGFRRT
jgi:hypothetical protein